MVAGEQRVAHRVSFMKQDVLKIELTGKTSAIPLESFLEVVSNTLIILQDIDANISEGQTSTVDWQIVEARLNSPLLLTIAGLSLLGVGEPQQVIKAYLEGVNKIEKGSLERPAFFSERALRKTGEIVSVLNDGIRKVVFSGGEEMGMPDVVPTKKVAEAVTVILESEQDKLAVQDREEPATVELRAYPTSYVEDGAVITGTLEMFSIHGKKPKFVIYDPLTNEDIDCYFSPDKYQEVRAALPENPEKPYRVEVMGRAKYNKKGHPISIAVETFRRLRDRNALPSFRDLEGINLSGDLDPTEYIRRLRNA